MKIKNTQVSVLFTIFFTLFCICLIGSNLFAVKPFSIGPLSFTGAIFLFPISYIINDVVTEVWGFKRARMMIFSAFFLNLFFVLAGFLVDLPRGADWWASTSQAEGFHSVFGLAPRVAIASFMAFLVGSLINAKMMAKMKEHHNNRYFTWRAVASSLVGELSDSLIFFPIALAGVVIPWKDMPLFVIWQVTLKTMYEIIILPITIRTVKKVKELENID